MRFTANIVLKQPHSDKIVNKFECKYFVNEKDDVNYSEFLSFLELHEDYVEDGFNLSYEGCIIINGIEKQVTKSFLNELYDVLEVV